MKKNWIGDIQGLELDMEWKEKKRKEKIKRTAIKDFWKEMIIDSLKIQEEMARI